jgi:hypothetical protein
VEVKCIEDVTRFVSAGKGEDLVDREVDRVEQVSDSLITYRRHEPPVGVARPFDLGRLSFLPHDSTHITGLIQIDINRVSVRLEQRTVGGERLGDPGFGVVEIVEISAESHRVRLDQDRSTTCEIRIEAPILRKEPRQTCLVLG